MRSRPQLVVAAVAITWGSVGVLVREIPLPATVIVAFRVWIAAAALAGWFLLHRTHHVPGPGLLRHRPARTLLSGVVLAVHWVLLFAALKRAPIGTVLLITYLAPVGVATLAPRALGEPLTRRTVGALALAVPGMVLVAAPSLDAAASGVALAAAGAALYVVLVLVGKPLAEVYGGVRLAFVQLAVAGAVLVPVAATARWDAPQASWAWLLPLGLVHTAVAIVLFLWALARLPATEVSILAYLEPAAAVVFGWLLLAESPGSATLAGGVLIVAAGAMVSGRGSGRRRVTAAGRTPAAPLALHPGPEAEVADVPG